MLGGFVALVNAIYVLAPFFGAKRVPSVIPFVGFIFLAGGLLLLDKFPVYVSVLIAFLADLGTSYALTYYAVWMLGLDPKKSRPAGGGADRSVSEPDEPFDDG